MSGWKYDGRENVWGGKTTGGNMSGVSKMMGGNMSGREFVRIPFYIHLFLSEKDLLVVTTHTRIRPLIVSSM